MARELMFNLFIDRKINLVNGPVHKIIINF